jgi:hypothetical protein
MKTMNRIAVCSPYTRALGFTKGALLRDKPLEKITWEKFGAESVPQYFTDGIRALRMHLTHLEDTSRPYGTADETRLWFMVESLIQARRLIEETKNEQLA